MRRELWVGFAYLVPGLAVTFVPDHSLRTGLVVLAAWSLLLVGALIWARRGMSSRRSRTQLVPAAVVVLASVLSLALGLSPAFPWLVGAWALVAAGWALVSDKRDGRFFGVVTLMLAAAELLLPVNPVVNVGVFGAYLVVIGVWTVIGALSPVDASTTEGAGQHHG